ncbi:HD domain-containing protein [Candidatus Woesearchaeota archaeon]|nr:HD domain-containing protein [Candidatus Woesearchaeota archaeon]
MKIPTKEECLRILKENNVPGNIIAHLNAVHDFSMKVADILEKRGIIVNRDLVSAGALLHDVKKLSPNDHVLEGYEYVKSLGYPEVAMVIKKHGLAHLDDEGFVPGTWEEKIVFYADKRVKGDKIVSVDERFEYIKQRYFQPTKDLNLSGLKSLQTATNSSDSCSLQYKKEDVENEIDFTKKIEKELLGDEKL